MGIIRLGGSHNIGDYAVEIVQRRVLSINLLGVIIWVNHMVWYCISWSIYRSLHCEYFFFFFLTLGREQLCMHVCAHILFLFLHGSFF